MYGPAEIDLLDAATPLFAGSGRTATDAPPASSLSRSPAWMSHGDRIETLPPGWQGAGIRQHELAFSAMGDTSSGRYGLQFHPEVTHTPQGAAILRAFAVGNICAALRPTGQRPTSSSPKRWIWSRRQV